MTTTSHALKHNGAAYNDAAALINADPKVTSGEGRALCTCGILSEALPSGSARRAWHKGHKAQAAAQAPEQTELVLGQDVLEGTPEDEVAEALAELVEPAPTYDTPEERKAHLQSFGKDAAPKKVSTRRKAEVKAAAPKAAKPAPKVKPAPVVDPNAVTVALPFTTDIADSFWRFLGRDAVRHLVDTAYPTVTAKTDANAHVIRFTGPSEAVPAAVQATEDLWHDAIAAAAEWKKTDPEFLARPKGGLAGRKASYFMTGEFYVAFAAKFAAEHTPTVA